VDDTRQGTNGRLLLCWVRMDLEVIYLEPPAE
jgi:hypothetical protein